MNYFYITLVAKVVVFAALCVWGPPWSAMAFGAGAAIGMRFQIVKYYMISLPGAADAYVPPDDLEGWGDAGQK